MNEAGNLHTLFPRLIASVLMYRLKNLQTGEGGLLAREEVVHF
jgi:hypothetical protein